MRKPEDPPDGGRQSRGSVGKSALWTKAAVCAAAVPLVIAPGFAGWQLAQGGPSSSGPAGRSVSAAVSPTAARPAIPAPTPTFTRTRAPTPASTPVATAESGVPATLDLDPPSGYSFNGRGEVSTSGTLTLGNGCTIRGVDFAGGDLALQIRGNGNTIRDCTFGAYSWAAVVLWIGNDNVIDGCKFNGVNGSGANIQVLGGKRNRITDNVTHGGITAIAFLYSRSANGGGRSSLIEDNVVTGNTCSGFSEEGITFDVLGNSAEDAAALEYDRIKAFSGSSVTLSPLDFPSYVGYDLIFLSGALRGQTRSIVKQSGATFALRGGVDGVTAGDEVVIGATFKHNLVSGNRVSGGGMGILLYGMAFGNRIEDNVVLDAGIKVESIDNLVIAAGSATQSYGRAPSGYNTIRHNTVSGEVSLEYHAIPMTDDHANAYRPYVSVGNNVIGNQCVRVNANNQYCYIAGNGGATISTAVTLSPKELVLP